MAEELVKANEFGNFTQKNDEEDPIIIVQRFLNIFRQLHIFNTRKREEFDQMLLKLPDEVRGKFLAIPGGALLQDYAKEVEAKHGIDRNFAATTLAKDYSDDIAKAKIFAQALTEAQAKLIPTAPQVVQQAPMMVMANEEVIKIQERISANNKAIIEAKKHDDGDRVNALQKENAFFMEKLKTVAANNAQPFMGGQGLSGDLKVIADKTFAKEMALALAQAIQAVEKQKPAEENMASSEVLTKIVEFSEEANKKNLETIAKTISESQIKLAQMMIEHNAANAIRMMPAEGEQHNVTRAPEVQMPPLQDIIGGVIKAQTEQLSSMISSALRESHKLSSQSIVEALSSFQKDNHKLMEIQHKNAVLRAKTKEQKQRMPEARPVPAPVQAPAPAPAPVFEPTFIPTQMPRHETIKTLSSGPVVKAEIKEEIAKAGLNNVLFDIDDLETPDNGDSHKKINTMTEVDKNFVIDKGENKSKGGVVFDQQKRHHEDFSSPLAPEITKKNAKEEKWELQEAVKNHDYELAELENKPGIVEQDVYFDSTPEDAVIYDSNENELQVINEKEDDAIEAGAGADDGEWEWEEVEVDEDGNEVASDENTTDGEWEWEYEEVEDEAPK